jgi:hypothetical protein
MWSNILFSSFLVGLAALLLISHAAAWRNTRESEQDEKVLDFHRRQFRRRMQASAMLGIVGLGVAGGMWIDAQDDTILSVAYWIAILLIVAWIAALAAADWVASRFYYDLIHTDQQTEHAAIQAELERIRSREGNGRADHS